jgi:hypothetical protein
LSPTYPPFLKPPLATPLGFARGIGIASTASTAFSFSFAASDCDLFGVGFFEAGGVEAFVDTLAALAFPGRALITAFSKFASALTEAFYTLLKTF